MSVAIHHNSTLSPRSYSLDGLSPAQAQVVAALAQGGSVTAAAAAAGLHRSTVYHWLRNEPKFANALAQARQDYVGAVADQLRQLSAQALLQLHALLDHPDTPPAVRLKACLAILERVGYPTPTWDLPPQPETAEQTHPSLPDPPTEPPASRNAPCPCGSGLKHKRCCGRLAPPRLSTRPPLPVPPN